MVYKRPSRAGCANVSGKKAPGEVGTTNNWYKLELAKVRKELRRERTKTTKLTAWQTQAVTTNTKLAKALAKEQKEAGKQPMQCRCLCRVCAFCDGMRSRRPRCAFRDGHKNMEPRFGIGMNHTCEEHLREEIDGYRRDAGGKIMVPHTIVSKLRAPLDPVVHVTDVTNGAY